MSFSTAFTFSINAPRIFGSGGFTFTLQAEDNTKYSTGTTSLGVAGIKPSISIGFGSSYAGAQGGYYNAWNGFSVFANGDRNNRVGSSYEQTIGAVTDGRPYYAWVEYDGTNNILDIRVSDIAQRPYAPTQRITGADIKAIFTADDGKIIKDVYAGFTGSAGDAGSGGEEDKIWNWYFINNSTPIYSNTYNFVDASNILISADPPGGQASSTIIASVYRRDGSPAAGVPVYFSTSFGLLDSTLAVTDATGKAAAILSTGMPGTANVEAVAAGGALAVTAVQLVVSDMDSVNFDKDWLTDALLLNGNSSLDCVTKAVYLPEQGLNGSTISWTSTKENIVAVDGKVTTLKALLPEEVAENSIDNNSCEFALEPAPILVASADPGDGELGVDTGKALTIGLNMYAEKGEGFDRITLKDNELNSIDIDKTLEDNILTVTPKVSLAKATRYKLTIPADAFGDAYGHTMTEAYSLSFTTTTSNPEVVFAYPANGMEETAPDTEIKLQYNQNILVGQVFKDITMTGPDSQKISASVSVEGDWLYIRPTKPLKENIAYVLTVPKGAVENDKGEVQQENYTVAFTTASNSSAFAMNIMAGSGGSITTGSSGHYEADAVIAIAATPASGYSFSQWSSSGGGTFADAHSASTTFTMPAEAVTITAVFTYMSSNGKNNTETTPAYTADVSGTSIPVIVNTTAHTEAVYMGDNFTGERDMVVTMPSIPGINAYILEISGTSLSSGSQSKGTLTFATGIGNITLTNNMISGISGIEGKKAEITIGQGERSNLLDKVKTAIGERPLVQLTLAIDGRQTEWNNPDAPITVSIPYTPSVAELANPESIVIWYIDGGGKAVSIPNGCYDQATGMVTFTTTHFSDYAVVYNKMNFNDVSAGAWYNQAVSFIAARNITTGTGNVNYSPEANLTRGEFIVLMMRAYEILPDSNSTDNFADAGNTFYTGYLAAAKRLGITAGLGNNLYVPGKEVTRQEMFTLLYKMLKIIGQLPQGSSGKTLSDFTDAGQVSSWAKEAMTVLVKTRVVGGNNGMLTPTVTTTRAEMAQVLYNILSR